LLNIKVIIVIVLKVQVIILYVATKKYLLDVPVENITRFESEFFEFLDTQYPQVPQAIKEEQVISDETEKTLVTAIEEFKKRFH
jgi:F-type H+-transporting ATPase subunit alpha